jgi:hypothetical protein
MNNITTLEFIGKLLITTAETLRLGLSSLFSAFLCHAMRFVRTHIGHRRRGVRGQGRQNNFFY